MKKAKKKRNPQDTTNRNLRVTRRQLAILYKATQGLGIGLDKLEKRVAELEIERVVNRGMDSLLNSTKTMGSLLVKLKKNRKL